ncbi:MAG: thioredoxin family protein [Synergistaceae bacterium]
MLLRIFGTGCARCNELSELTDKAAKELELDYTLEKVTDPQEIAMAGVIMTPALAIDNMLVVMGQVPSIERLKEILAADYTEEAESSDCGGCSG